MDKKYMTTLTGSIIIILVSAIWYKSFIDDLNIVEQKIKEIKAIIDKLVFETDEDLLKWTTDDFEFKIYKKDGTDVAHEHKYLFQRAKEFINEEKYENFHTKTNEIRAFYAKEFGSYLMIAFFSD